MRLLESGVIGQGKVSIELNNLGMSCWIRIICNRWLVAGALSKRQ